MERRKRKKTTAEGYSGILGENWKEYEHKGEGSRCTDGGRGREKGGGGRTEMKGSEPREKEESKNCTEGEMEDRGRDRQMEMRAWREEVR